MKLVLTVELPSPARSSWLDFVLRVAWSLREEMGRGYGRPMEYVGKVDGHFWTAVVVKED